MAKNTSAEKDNKRIAVKHIRDKAKAAYEKHTFCYICGTETDLELHHLHSITKLLNSWADKYSHDISTDEAVLAIRDEFIATHHQELYELVYTLCNKDHVKLHSIYGKAPSPASVDKQERWIEIQKAKHTSNDYSTAPTANELTLRTFSEFY